jgi:putative oxidoreductase
MSIGTVAIRGVVGPLFVGHGTQKLFGWFAGHGLEGTAGFFENVGLRPGRRNAMAAGASEALGGLLLTLGALTPVATTMIAGTMVTAIRKVHAPNGPWVTEQGYEYNLVIIAAMAALADRGPGSPSVDAKLLPGMKGAGWAVASMGAAVAGSYLLDRVNEPAPEQPQTSSAGDPASTDEPRFSKDRTPTGSQP